MRCKLTHKEGNPVKAHIIASAFHDRSPKTSSLIVGSGKNHYPKRSRTGLYDAELVTAEGEEIFKKLDDYAYKLLVENRGALRPYVLEGKLVGAGLNTNEFDYSKLKLFFLSLLWRASETSLLAFNKVKLGPHAEVIRQMVVNGNPGSVEKYSVIPFRFQEDQATPFKKGSLIYPYREKLLGITIYRFFLCEYTFMVKVDNRKTPEPFNHLQLSPDMPFRVVDRPFRGSPEAKIVRHLLDKNEGRMPAWFLKASKNDD